MHFNLTEGVDLSIIKTSQFKTNQIIVNFATTQTEKYITARSLLADVMETSTQKYPTQTALARREAELYGMYLGTNASRIGNLHNIKIRASFLNDQYSQSGLLNQVIETLGELIFRPLVNDCKFDEATFNTQKTNLASSITSLNDDKQYYASMELRKLFFDNDSAMQIPSFGRVSDLEGLTAAKLVDVYQEMITHDKINIVLLGDVDEQQALADFSQLKFSPREIKDTTVLYRQALHEVFEKEEKQELKQSKLNLAYRLPVYFQDTKYYAAIVMNGILGGTPLSKLFVNVREKESLAYYANSNFNAFNGVLTIQTGIESQNKGKAIKLIKQQVAAVELGDFSDELLQEVKDGLVHHFLSGLDSSSNGAERALMNDMFDNEKTIDEVVGAINAVDADAVVEVAKLLKLQAVYFLNGESI